jgi:UDPglucose 6-dehydrogenase
MRISVVGLGKLGAPLLAVLASRGFEVCGVDVNETAVNKINAGLAPVAEPQVQGLLAEHRTRLRATPDWQVGIGGTDVTCVLVPTPSGVDGAFKNDYVLHAIENIGRVLRHKPGYHLVVVNSTTMPGSVDGPIRQQLERVSGRAVGDDIGLCYNPEFVALGSVVEDLLQPDFVLIGESDERAGTLLSRICRKVVGPSVPISRMSCVNAELAKISINAFVTMKISFANMLAEICEGLDGADADIVTGAIGQDTRIGGKYLRAGTGYGGPCFPRDTIAFAAAAGFVGVDATAATAAHTINQRQIARILRFVDAQAQPGDTVAVMGLSYKPGTNVVEQSQGVMLAAALARCGYRVIAHDPLASDPARAVLGTEVSFAATPQEAVTAANVVTIMVPWPEYREFFASWRGDLATRAIIDCWRLVDRSAAAPDITVVQLGRGEPRTESAHPANMAAQT